MTSRQAELFSVLAGPTTLALPPLATPVPTAWVTITGAPGAGKSTICAELIKAGRQVIPEASRAAIDEAMHQGFSATEIFADRPLLSEAILTRKLAIARTLPPSAPLIWDTGLVDALVFCRWARMGLTRVPAALTEYRFRGVIFLDPLPQAAVGGDVARPQTEIERAMLHEMLRAEYAGQGYHPAQIPQGSVGERLGEVLAALRSFHGEAADR